MSDEESARIIGFRATGGPLFQASLPIQPGLTVIYGLNGSGKTHLLNALHSVLSGCRQGLDRAWVNDRLEASLIVRGDPGAFDRWRRAGGRGEEWRLWHGGGSTRFRANLRALHRQIEDEGSWDVVAPEPRAGESPAWRIRPAVTPIPGSPARVILEAEGRLWALWERGTGIADEEEWGPAATFDGWISRFFLDQCGSVFYPEEFPLPADDGMPLPVSELPDAYEALWLPPVNGLRVVIESRSAEHSNVATREALGRLEGSGASLPSASGWEELPQDPEAALEAMLSRGTRIEGPGEDPAEFQLQMLDLALAVETDRVLTEFLKYLETLVNELLSTFLLDPPDLRLNQSNSPYIRYSGRAVEWVSSGRPLTSLSTAQRRWVDLAVSLALEATLNAPAGAPIPGLDVIHFQRHTFVILDEPESALHRTAEAHMVRGLEWLGRQPGMHVVVATHSPLLVDSRSALVARLHERPVVSPEEGILGNRSRVSPLVAIHRDHLDLLGLMPSDLLRRSRVILLVEGQHDEIVAKEYLSRVLGGAVASRLEFVPVRGARHLPEALDSRLLFDFTDATIVPVVDNLRAEHVTATWERALVLGATEGGQAAGDFLRSQLPASDAAENGFLAQFLSRAIVLGVQSRVIPFSLPAVDVIDYLPVTAFVSKAKSWRELRGCYREEVGSGTTRLSSFKLWVEKKYRTDFSDDRIRKALAQVEGCPEDFQALADLCARLS